MKNMKTKKKNFAEKITNYLLNILIIIFGIIFLISIYTGVQTKILGNDYTDFFGFSIFEVQTGSMADTVNAGDWIIVKLTQKVKLNDIVTYELDGEYITHRIIEVYNGTYITKGDANNAKDEPVDQNKIVGKVVSIWSGFGIIRKTLFNPSVLIALIITMFMFNLAFKKNKVGESKLNKKEKNYLIFGTIAKKIRLILEKNKKEQIKIDENNSNVIRRLSDLPLSKPDELDKTLVYRNISVNPNEVDDKYKGLVRKIENNEYKEDDLEKTAIYRNISVDSNEVDDKYKELVREVKNDEYVEDELDKTALYRVISVDISEIENTSLEIAENEIKEAEMNNKKKEKMMNLEQKQGEKNEIKIDETLTDINLDLLKTIKNNKKSKTIIDTAMLIKKEELNELINIIIEDNKTRHNEDSIKNTFITAYIDAKYYNYYGDRNTDYYGKSLTSKIEKIIEEVASELINGYHGKDTNYNDLVDIYSQTLTLIVNLEHARDSITDLKAKEVFYKKEIIKYYKDYDNQKVKQLTDDIIKIQKNYINMLEYFFKSLETNMFILNLNKFVSIKDMYGLELKHNVLFSKVYSDYIIDKTYTEGIIAEDKLSVLTTLLLVQLIKDMISSDFNRKYILYIPKTLYAKEKKIEKFLRYINDEYAKENIIILISFEDLLSNKQIVNKVRKMGYKFALLFDKETVIEEKDRGNIYIADYIFVNKKVANMRKLLSFIPEELSNKVIYEDLVDKVGDLGSE